MMFFINRLVPALFFTWFFNLLFLYLGGKYTSFLSTRMEFFFILTIAIFAIFSLSYFGQDLDKTHIKDKVRHIIASYIFVVPLVFLMISVDKNLGSEAFERKHLQATVQNNTSLAKPITPMKKAEPNGETELLALLRDYKDHLNKEVITAGQIYREKDIPQGYFMLYRFLVTCCTADARPIAIVTSETDESLKLAKDSWVHVEGTLIKKHIDGEENVIIESKVITPTTQRQKRSAYLYN